MTDTDALVSALRSTADGSELPMFPALGDQLTNAADTIERLTRELAEAREKVAKWMIDHSFATGHGDVLDDLLAELGQQVDALRAERDAARAELAALQAALQDPVFLRMRSEAINALKTEA